MKTNNSLLRIFFLSAILFIDRAVDAQTYPEPEFANEVYYLKKDKDYSLVRLEKSSSKMENKTKIVGPSENSYSIEGDKSPVRLSSGTNFSFVISKGSSQGSSSPKSDSMMKANGLDPNMMDEMSMGGDPSQAITLYKVSSEKNMRKIYLMKVGGYFSMGKNKLQSSDKMTFSVKKVKSGYWELVIDKPLTKGEYAFTMMGMGGGGMDGSTLIFAFGVD
jgi:hypothetical protein